MAKMEVLHLTPTERGELQSSCGSGICQQAIGSFLLVRFLSHRIGLSEKLAIVIFLFATAAALLYQLEPLAMLIGLLVLVAIQLLSFHLLKQPKRS